MCMIFADGRWPVVLRVSEALALAGFDPETDTRGEHGKYAVFVDMREHVAARRVIAALGLI